MAKILFIQPTQYAENGKLCKQKKINLPGLAFPLLASYTLLHWKVDLAIEVVDEINFDSDADIIAIGTMGHATFRGLEIAREFKNRNKTVVMGGYMASIAYQEDSKYVDSVVVGDAEISYPKMLKDFELTGKVQPIHKDIVTELKNLPLPRYDLLTQKELLQCCLFRPDAAVLICVHFALLHVCMREIIFFVRWMRLSAILKK